MAAAAAARGRPRGGPAAPAFQKAAAAWQLPAADALQGGEAQAWKVEAMARRQWTTAAALLLAVAACCAHTAAGSRPLPDGGTGSEDSEGLALEQRDGDSDEDATALLDAWRRAYGLDDPLGRTVRPFVSLPESTPRAPHLHDCHTVALQNKAADRRHADGAMPPWAVVTENPAFGNASALAQSAPPWVEGADAGNLLGTRAAQAYLWWHQHPANCTDPALRFLYIPWRGTHRKGVGSQLHWMSVAMGYALLTGRILVVGDNYVRADHPGCAAAGEAGRFQCYFRSPAAEECEVVAKRLWLEQGGIGGPDNVVMGEPPASVMWAPAAKAAHQPNICPGLWCTNQAVSSAIMSRRSAGSVESGGRLREHVLDWWRAQSIRYLLRFPTGEHDNLPAHLLSRYIIAIVVGTSEWARLLLEQPDVPAEYLCHMENIARHEAYGGWVAELVAASERRRLSLAMDDDASSRRQAQGELETTLWQSTHDVLVPRPIVTMHVRGGAKKREMALFSLRAFMEQAERVRSHDPNVHTIWLASMLGSVLEEAEADYTPRWTFLSTRQRRLTRKEEDGDFDDIPSTPMASDASPEAAAEAAAWALKSSVDLSFVNLLVQSQADYFVGTLGSNWDRLVDELRKTNGRLRSGFIALNYGQN
eukprot:SM000212S06920  [mRNA]  locus=s212:186294:189231:- [translate_table: standard]